MYSFESELQKEHEVTENLIAALACNAGTTVSDAQIKRRRVEGNSANQQLADEFQHQNRILSPIYPNAYNVM